MKLSVSVPDEDVAFLDRYAEQEGVGSRSAAVQRAIRLLRATQLERDYADAWQEWDADKTNAYWDSVVGDGLEK